MKFSLVILFLSLSQQVHVNADKESQCTLYMAPSSTEEEDDFKLGMYAGVDFQPGQIIAAPEIAIPLVHMITHNKNEDPDFFSEHANFMWNRETIHANFEVFPDAEDEARINIAIPGIGAFGNQHITSFANTEFDDEAVLDRIQMTSRYQNGASPFVGASSQYYGVTMKSTRPISAGEELFMNGLGDVEDEEYLLKVEDFESVDDALKKILDIFSNHKDSIDDKKKQEIYDYVYNVFESSMTKSESDDDNGMIEEVLALFPENATDVERVLEEGGTFVSEFPESRRSIDWLKENGQCSDGLYLGLGANDKGAFSKRDVKKFDLISPSPLLMIQNKDYLSMYDTVIGEDRVDVVGEVPVSKQLFINYCLGHPESSLLFYPYGMGVNMINHRPSYAGANAKIVWSKAPYFDAGIRDLTVDELVKKYGAVLPLGIDIVATTDIAADEEIFIDYGEEWEQAMHKHEMEWAYTAILPKEAWQIAIEREGEPFLSAPEMADGEKEGSEESLPEGVTTACHAFGTFNEDEDNLPKEGGLLTLEFNAKKTERNGHNFSMCEIIGRISREDSSYLYTVKMLKMSEFNDKDVIIRSVPHSNIRYVDKPYTSALHRRTSFRHPIMLPDRIFPLSWRNIDGES